MGHHELCEGETDEVKKYENTIDTLNDELFAYREDYDDVYEEKDRKDEVDVELADQPAVLRQGADIVKQVEADDQDENRNGDRAEDDLQ